MALIVEDRVRDTSTTTGTGTITLSGTAPVRYRTFASVVTSDGDTFPYAIVHRTLDEWEVGLGTRASATTFTRTTIYSSTNAGAAVNFSAGTKDVMIVHPGTPGIYSEIIDPLLSGGTAASSTLTLQSTTGTGTTDAILFKTASQTERLRINSSGRILSGTAGGTEVTTSSGTLCFLQASGSSGADNDISMARFSANATPPHLHFLKSRSASVGGFAVLSANDSLGQIRWDGADGDQFVHGAQIEALVDGTPGDNDMPTRLVFYTTPDASATTVERLRIDSAGHAIIGGSANIGYAGNSPNLQIVGTSFDGASMVVQRFINNGNGGSIALTKSRGGTIGTQTSVSSGDVLGTIIWAGTDGTNYIEAAHIQAVVDGTPGANDMPTRLGFWTTADGAASPTERMRINNAGNTTLKGPGAAYFFSEEAVLAAHMTGSQQSIDMLSWRGANTFGPSANFGKSRGSTIGSFTVVADGDTLGELRWWGADGTQFIQAANIQAVVNGSPGSGDMPTALIFKVTADAGNSPTECLRIAQNGFVGIGSTNPQKLLHIEADDASNNAVTTLFELRHTTSGTPAVGIGVGIDMNAETSASNVETLAKLNAHATSVGAGTENAEFDVYLLGNGTNKKWLTIGAYSAGGEPAVYFDAEMAAAATGAAFGIGRRTASGAGAILSIDGGSAQAGSTNQDGGNVYIVGGIATGSGNSEVRLYYYGHGGSGTADASSVAGLIVSEPATDETPLTTTNSSGTAKRIVYGAADSGGAGFRMLRIAN